ncbi:hypothetical protein RHEC894_PE00203 (plasmid) [Rhizobium sp. CIAT894]|nr:hypothetical protein RHEC894_PE00203 [Rhizobium sp. CIAT894]
MAVDTAVLDQLQRRGRERASPLAILSYSVHASGVFEAATARHGWVLRQRN